jgi:hypothetical protein
MMAEVKQGAPLLRVPEESDQIHIQNHLSDILARRSEIIAGMREMSPALRPSANRGAKVPKKKSA